MATLYVLQGPDKGCTFEITEERSTLGRHFAQVSLTDHTISRRHAQLELKGDHWEIVDLGSSNGTYVNGERIRGPSALRHGDQIKVGATFMVFRGRTDVGGFRQSGTAREMIDVSGRGDVVDSSVLSAIESSEESVILAAPETAEAVRAWNLMYQLAEAIGAISSISDLLKHVTDIIFNQLVVDRVFIVMRDEATGELEPVAFRYRTKPKGKRKRITTSQTIIHQVLDTKSGVLCANATADKRFAGEAKAASLRNLALRSVICVPIVGHDEVMGVIHLDCPMSRHTYTQEQLRLATAIGRVVGMAIENHRLIEARMRQERLAATGETVAYLSHHIRNILQGLRSGADVVELGLEGESTQSVRMGWQVVQHNLDRIFHLTSNMLTFTKDREPRIELAQLNSIIDDAVGLAQRQAEEKGVTISSRPDADIPAVPLDPEGIHQAIFNLIINAVSACPDHDGQVRVRTRFHAPQTRISVTVSDNGPGIPRDRLKHIFLPFHSTKGHGGTGLGLAAAKKIVEELGGEIIVTSKVGKGTRFEVLLPAERTVTSDLEATHGPAK